MDKRYTTNTSYILSASTHLLFHMLQPYFNRLDFYSFCTY